MREACLRTIRFRIPYLKALSDFHAETPAPGAVKKQAKALARGLRKALALSKSVGPLFDDVYEDRGNSAGDYRRTLNRAIAVADYLSERLIVPNGCKPRDANKFLAKNFALDLVREFCPFAWKTGEREVINLVAELTYWIIAGRSCSDISEPLEAYKPPTYRTRGEPPRLTLKK